MLDVMANVAQILGFGLDLYNTRMKAYPPGSAEVMVTLEALAKTSKGWKELHTVFHSLNFHVQGIVEITTKFEGGQREPRRLSEITPSALRRYFFSSGLSNAVEVFDGDTRRCIRVIRENLDSRDPNFHTNIIAIRKSPISFLADDLQELASKRDDVLIAHEKISKFLSGIKIFVHKPDWESEEISYFLENRTLLSVNYPNIISNTDKVLMTLLDIFIEISQINGNGRRS